MYFDILRDFLTNEGFTINGKVDNDEGFFNTTYGSRTLNGLNIGLKNIRIYIKNDRFIIYFAQSGKTREMTLLEIKSVLKKYKDHDEIESFNEFLN